MLLFRALTFHVQDAAQKTPGKIIAFNDGTANVEWHDGVTSWHDIDQLTQPGATTELARSAVSLLESITCDQVLPDDQRAQWQRIAFMSELS